MAGENLRLYGPEDVKRARRKRAKFVLEWKLRKYTWRQRRWLRWRYRQHLKNPVRKTFWRYQYLGEKFIEEFKNG